MLLRALPFKLINVNYFLFILHQGLAILKASFNSKKVLTDVFLASGMHAWLERAVFIFHKCMIFEFLYFWCYTFHFICTERRWYLGLLVVFSFIITYMNHNLYPQKNYMNHNDYYIYYSFCKFTIFCKSNWLIAEIVLRFGLPSYIHHFY